MFKLSSTINSNTTLWPLATIAFLPTFPSFSSLTFPLQRPPPITLICSICCPVLFMEWFYESSGDELVPREQRGAQLHDRWTQWGFCSNGSFDSSEKYFVNDNKLSDEVEINLYSQEKRQSSGLTGLSAQTPYVTGLCSMFAEDQSYALNEEAVQTDGGFMPEWNLTKIADLSEHSTTDTHSVKNEMWDFSLSKEQNNKHFITTLENHPMISNEKVSASPHAYIENVSVPTKNDKYVTEFGNGNMSVEESLLLDFEIVMNRMSEQTRYCFRDALYRLARNSGSPSSYQTEYDNNNTLIPWQCTTNDESSRHNKSKDYSEADTNAIDRTVASLMFSNMNFSLDGPRKA